MFDNKEKFRVLRDELVSVKKENQKLFKIVADQRKHIDLLFKRNKSLNNKGAQAIEDIINLINNKNEKLEDKNKKLEAELVKIKKLIKYEKKEDQMEKWYKKIREFLCERLMENVKSDTDSNIYSFALSQDSLLSTVDSKLGIFTLSKEPLIELVFAKSSLKFILEESLDEETIEKIQLKILYLVDDYFDIKWEFTDNYSQIFEFGEIIASVPGKRKGLECLEKSKLIISMGEEPPMLTLIREIEINNEKEQCEKIRVEKEGVLVDKFVKNS